MKKISVVVPMYNEEEVANECYKRLKDVIYSIPEYDYEFIFVNDGSKDKTLDIIKTIANSDKKVKVISFSRNFGHQSAVSAGLKEITGDVVFIMDADLQDPPEIIPELIKYQSIINFLEDFLAGLVLNKRHIFMKDKKDLQVKLNIL